MPVHRGDGGECRFRCSCGVRSGVLGPLRVCKAAHGRGLAAGVANRLWLACGSTARERAAPRRAKHGIHASAARSRLAPSPLTEFFGGVASTWRVVARAARSAEPTREGHKEKGGRLLRQPSPLSVPSAECQTGGFGCVIVSLVYYRCCTVFLACLVVFGVVLSGRERGKDSRDGDVYR